MAPGPATARHQQAERPVGQDDLGLETEAWALNERLDLSARLGVAGPGKPSDVTASESGERLPPAEPSRTQPEPELTPRETRQHERAVRRGERPQGMVPGRERRRSKVERGAMRLVATGGIVGIAVVLGAVLVGQNVTGWIVGLVIGLTTVILAALLWSSRQL